jgi:hypothetical protein
MIGCAVIFSDVPSSHDYFIALDSGAHGTTMKCDEGLHSDFTTTTENGLK